MEATGAFDPVWRYHCVPVLDFCREEGEFTAAAEMTITVPAFARFMLSVMNADGYGPDMIAERNAVHTIKDRPLFFCDTPGSDGCPREQGYGLGWEILDYGDERVLSHGGHDPSVLTQTYFYEARRDGVIIFLSAPLMPTLEGMARILELVDPGGPLAQPYQGWLAWEQAQAERGD